MAEIKLSDVLNEQTDPSVPAADHIRFLEPFAAGDFLEVARAQGKLRNLEKWLDTPEADELALQ